MTLLVTWWAALVLGLVLAAAGGRVFMTRSVCWKAAGALIALLGVALVAAGIWIRAVRG